MPAETPSVLHRVGAAAAGIGRLGAGRPRMKLAIELAVVALVVAFLAIFLATQWSALPDYDWRFEPGWLAVSAIAVAGFYMASAQVWLGLVAALGEQLDGTAGRAIYGKSLVARYVPTSALALVGRVVLAEREGVSKRVTLASVAYELGCSLTAAVAVGSYFVVTLPALEGSPARWAILAVVPLALAGLHPRVFRPLADRALRMLGREPLPAALPFGKVLLFVLLISLLWSMIGFGLYAFAAALHPLDLADLPFVAASYAVGFCVAVLTFIVPAGLGSRDAALAAGLDVVVPGSVAIAIAVAFRIFQTSVELLWVGAVTWHARRRSRAQRS